MRYLASGLSDFVQITPCSDRVDIAVPSAPLDPHVAINRTNAGPTTEIGTNVMQRIDFGIFIAQI